MGTRQLGFLVGLTDIGDICEYPSFDADLDEGGKDCGDELGWRMQE